MNNKWGKIQASVGLFTDLKLYFDALEIGERFGYINLQLLESISEKSEEEPFFQRVKGMKLIKTFKKRTFFDLIRELELFGFTKNGKVLVEGKELIRLYKDSIPSYNEKLLIKMHDMYIMPGWFIDCLWQLNPQGQGQIIIPAPIKEWKPSAKQWENKNWDNTLIEICRETYVKVTKLSQNAFPIKEDNWIDEIKKEYLRQGAKKQKRVGHTEQNEDKKIQTFSPRKRLTSSMQNVTVKMLFEQKYKEQVDTIRGKYQYSINSRTYMIWCTRLEALGLLFYSDSHPQISGRILFPTSLFRKESNNNSFKKIPNIQKPNGQMLHIHTPEWKDFAQIFIEKLYIVYHKIYNEDGIIYVSLQQVRDEACRLLRINAYTFEHFLEKTFDASIRKEIDFVISLETDIREDQKSGYQLYRRSVYVRNVPHSLIAIRKI